MALYNISRCVDSGNYHKELQANEIGELAINEAIPTCCKIELEQN